MDILKEYEKNQPKIQPTSMAQAQKQLMAQRYGADTGFFVRMVLRLSGGRIQNTRQASYVLLTVAICVFLTSLIVFFFSSSGRQSTVVPPAKININQ